MSLASRWRDYQLRKSSKARGDKAQKITSALSAHATHQVRLELVTTDDQLYYIHLEIGPLLPRRLDGNPIVSRPGSLGALGGQIGYNQKSSEIILLTPEGDKIIQCYKIRSLTFRGVI